MNRERIPERALAMLMSGELSRWLTNDDEANLWHMSLYLQHSQEQVHAGMLSTNLVQLAEYWDTKSCPIPGHGRCIPFLGGHIVTFEDDEREAR